MKFEKIAYRPEIDGLRAVAILSVLFFHVGFGWMPGGYIGVDVFFVISGYLITGILANQVQEGRFTFAAFYGSRVRRLAPALLATVVGSIVGGAFLFSTKDFARLGSEVFPVLLGISNVYYAGKAGYFDAEGGSLPLLHTWSLAVEEQIYLVVPIIVWYVYRNYTTRALLLVTLSLAFISLVASEFWLYRDTTEAYYLTPFRSFEFSIGALLHWAPDHRKGNKWLGDFLIVGGLALIVFSATWFTKDTRFPGLMALLPVAGSAMVLYVRQANLAMVLLKNPVFVGIGLISYSVYLVHWPIVVFYDYFTMASPDRATDPYLLLVLSLITGTLFYRLFERPFRSGRSKSQRLSPAAFSLVCACIAMVVMGPSAVIWGEGGWPWRIANKQPREAEGYGDCRNLSRCNIGALSGKTVFLVGDSHAKHLSYGLDIWGKQNNVKIVAFTSPACNVTPLKYQTRLKVRTDCEELKKQIASEMADNPETPVIIAQSWRGYRGIELAEKALVRYLKKYQDRNILLVAQMPKPEKPIYLCGFVPNYVMSKDVCRSFKLDRGAMQYTTRWRKIADGLPNVTLANVGKAICDDVMCRAKINGRNLYSDTQHLSASGSLLVAQRIIGPALKNILK